MKKLEQIQLLRKLQERRNCTEICLIIFAVLKITCTSVLSAITCYWFSSSLQKYFIEKNQPMEINMEFTTYEEDYYTRERSREMDGILDLAKIYGGTMFISVASFVFSIILTVGLIKRKPRLLFAYFVYGIAMIALSIFAVILGAIALLLPILFGYRSANATYIITFIAVAYTIYATILAVVLATYKRMGAESQDNPESLLPYSKVNLGFMMKT